MAIKTHSYYMMMAEQAAIRGTCNRRQIGCILVDIDGEVLAEGYNGTPLQFGDCRTQQDLCPGRDIKAGLVAGNTCYGVHAEIRALKDCDRIGRIHMMYTTKAPCTQCVLALLTTPCTYIYFKHASNEKLNQELWERSGGVWTWLDDKLELIVNE